MLRLSFAFAACFCTLLWISSSDAAEAALTQSAMRAAIEKSLPLLMAGATGHRENRTCFACHNQGPALFAIAAGRSRGFTVDEEELQRLTTFITEFLGKNRENYLQGKGTGGQADTAGYALWTLAAIGYPADEVTSAVSEYLLLRHKDLDYWKSTSNRPPSEVSSFTTSYMGLYGLSIFGTSEQEKRIDARRAQVREWLLKTPAQDNEDRVFRLWGLAEAGADSTQIAAAAKELLARQRDDGGWAQLDSGEPQSATESDAYATGTALVALHQTGQLSVTDPAYRKGLSFLLRTQQDDGSWHVASRSKPFQAYFESGFPHGKDQFISCAASGWATWALVLAVEQSEVRGQKSEVGNQGSGGEGRAADVKHVVFVSIDGLAASYLDDPRAELPTLRMLAKRGAVAKGMITSFPSVTWPSHTSLVTGVQPARHGVIGNSVWNRKLGRAMTYIGDPELTKDEAIKVPTLYDAAAKAGLKSGSVIWPCSSGAKSLSWVIPDAGKPELHAKYTTPGLVEELGKAGIDISKLGEWGWNKDRSTQRDLLYTKVANYLVQEKQANLVLVHLITPDGVEHAYGPHTPEAYQAVAESDQRIAEIWQALQAPALAGKATLFVVSDHGFAPYEQFIRPNVVLKELGLISTDDANKVTARKAWCVAQGGSAFIYVLEANDRAGTVKQLKERLGKVEGVTGVVGPEGFAALGFPPPEANVEAPDFVLLTGPGYSFNEAVTGEAVGGAGGLKGSHGHDPQPAYMHATFIAAGSGIKTGVQLDQINNVDVAPTIAQLMGFKLEDVDGRVLKEILE
jgi:predicted AlkP superfamily pyrophosphatase or phosphodiesterase